MPDSGHTPEPSRKPTLADQHWRAQLRRKPQDEATKDMTDAVEKNDSWRFSMLLQLDIDWARQDQLMRRTIELGRDDMFRALIDKDPDWGNSSSITTLAGYAAESGKLEFVKIFVDKYKVDVHHYSDEMLRNASRNGHEEIVGYLISKGADFNAWNGDPLKDAAENGHLGVVKKLIEAGADMQAGYGDPLERAARGGHTAIVDYLISKGSDPKANNCDAFITACRYGKTEVVEAFLKNGVEPDARDNEGIIAACEAKAFDTALLLVSKGASIDAQQGRVLRLSAYRGETEIVKFLLDNHANPNARQHNETPLTEAVRGGQKAIVKLLLKNGADQSLMNWEAWRVARRNRDRDMQHTLVEGERKARETFKTVKLAEFSTAFSGGYTLDDLREKKGASGESGLVLAARSGRFADLVRNAKGGALVPADLFHPDDRLDSVMTILAQTKTLQQFFDPAFWTGRTGQVVDAYESLPEALRNRVKFDGITAQINHQMIMKKAKDAANGLKPPKIK